MSEKKETLDPEIWTLSIIGDVYGFIDEAFLDIPVNEQDALKDFLDSTDVRQSFIYRCQRAFIGKLMG